jgi:hypothetical protein
MKAGQIAALSFAAGIAGWAAPVLAVDPFEIQVYEGDINQPLQAGMELHSNVAVPRPAAPDIAGGPAQSLLRVTFEPSFGLLEWWEVGAYLQFALGLEDAGGHFGGFKLRSKWIVPRRLTGPFIFGLNVEVGRGAAVFGDDDWDTEFRPIAVWTHRRFMIAANPLVGWALSGPARGLRPDVEPAFKVRADTGRGFGVGLEYYAGLGPLGRIEAPDRQEHILYLIGDLIDAPVDLNIGIGRGLTGVTTAWTFKTILGVGF